LHIKFEVIKGPQHYREPAASFELSGEESLLCFGCKYACTVQAIQSRPLRKHTILLRRCKNDFSHRSHIFFPI